MCAPICALRFLGLKLEYSVQTRFWLLIQWLLSSPGHQQPRYHICCMDGSFLSRYGHLVPQSCTQEISDQTQWYLLSFSAMPMLFCIIGNIRNIPNRKDMGAVKANYSILYFWYFPIFHFCRVVICSWNIIFRFHMWHLRVPDAVPS